MPTPRLRLGQLLVDARMITAAALDEVLALQRTDGRRLGTMLVERGLINETQLTQILSHQLSVPWVSLLHIEFSRQLLNLVPREVADKYCLVPIYVRHVRNQGDTLYVAMDDPSNEDGLQACREHAGLPVRAMIAPPTDIRGAIRVYYGVTRASLPPPDAAPKPPASVPSKVVLSPDGRTTLASGVSPSEAATPVSTVREGKGRQEAAEAAALEKALEKEASAAVAVSSVETPKPETPPTIEPPTTKPERPGDVPQIETIEIDAELDVDGTADEVAAIPEPRGRAPRMVALTLLDGTTIRLPAKHRRSSGTMRAVEPADPARAATAEAPVDDPLHGLTARDLVLALRVVADGADASEVLGENVRWEALFSALLSLLLKKHLIADWEFVDELKAQR